MATTMNVTKVKIRLNENDTMKNVKAYATVILNDALRICGLKVINGVNGLFVSYPSFKRPSGEYYELVSPVNSNEKKLIQEQVLNSFHTEMIAHTTT